MVRPEDAAFTTLLWMPKCGVAFLDRHMARLQRHAKRLGLEWKDVSILSITEILTEAIQEAEPPREDQIGMVSLTFDGEEFSAKARVRDRTPNQITATAVQATSWSKEVYGTKHADWQPYIDAGILAEERGSGMAFMVDDEIVVDGNVATPVVLDHDGTLWYTSHTEGAIDSVTLEAMTSHLVNQGIPVSSGRVTRSLLSRAALVAAVGTGVGVVQVIELDGQPLGSDHESRVVALNTALEAALSEGWTALGVSYD